MTDLFRNRLEWEAGSIGYVIKQYHPIHFLSVHPEPTKNIVPITHAGDWHRMRRHSYTVF